MAVVLMRFTELGIISIQPDDIVVSFSKELQVWFAWFGASRQTTVDG